MAGPVQPLTLIPPMELLSNPSSYLAPQVSVISLVFYCLVFSLWLRMLIRAGFSVLFFGFFLFYNKFIYLLIFYCGGFFIAAQACLELWRVGASL